MIHHTFIEQQQGAEKSIVKVVELVGVPTKVGRVPYRKCVEHASGSLRHITGVDVVRKTAHCVEGKISEYRATVNVAFNVDEYALLLSVAGRREL